MNPPSDLGTLLQRAQAGDQDAAAEFYETCRNPLRRAIRAVLSRPMRDLMDSDDLLQDAFLQIFSKRFAGDVLATPHRLLAYPERIAANQVRDKTRKYLLTARYGIGSERSLGAQADDEMQARELSPHEAAILNELVYERLNAYLESLRPVDRLVVALILKGKAAREIAISLKMEPKGVYRIAERAKKRLSE